MPAATASSWTWAWTWWGILVAINICVWMVLFLMTGPRRLARRTD